jgi:hypothetical protein
VYVDGSKGIVQGFQGLIRQGADVSGIFPLDSRFDFPLTETAAEEELEICLVLQP